MGEKPLCDSRLAAKDMSLDCVNFIWYSYLIIGPFLKFCVFIIVLLHPIKGERLTNLYLTQGDHHQVVTTGAVQQVETMETGEDEEGENEKISVVEKK